MATKFDSPKAALWRQRLKRFEASPLSVTRFCAEEGCSQASFYQWRKKLRPLSDPPVEQTNSRDDARADRFRPVTLALAAPLEIQFPSGARLEMTSENLPLVCAVVREMMRFDPPIPEGDDEC